MIPAYDDHFGNSLPGANREPDTAYATIGMLQSIRYPTGGVVSFEYEMNDYSYSDKGYVNHRGELDSSVYTHSVVLSTAGLSGSGTVEKRDTIYVPPIGYDDYNATVSYKISGPNNSDPLADVSILDMSGNEIWSRVVSYGVFQTESVNLPCMPSGASYVLVVRRYTTTYTAILHLDFPDWQINPLPAVFSLNAGGCRIKRIVEYDGLDHAHDKVRRFSYLLNDTTSSGYLLDQPLYMDNSYTTVICTAGGYQYKAGDYTYITRHSTSLASLGRTQGSFIGYSKVTVLYGDSAENGREEFYYNTLPHDQGGVGYPYIPKSSNDDLRGLLQTHAIYDKNGAMLRKTGNNYNLHASVGDPNFKWIFGFKVGILRRDVWYDINNCPLSTAPWTFRGAVYKMYQLWPVLTSTTDSLYDVARGTTIGSVSYFDYDTTNLLLKQQKTIKSTGDTVYTYFTYPQDYAGQAVYDSMTSRHIWARGIERTSYVGTTLTYKEKRNYDFWSGNLIAIKSQSDQKGSSAYETRQLVHGYDKYENLLEQSKPNDLHNVYIWDYASQYMTANVVNADTASIAYTSFEADGSGGWAIASASRDSTTAITGVKSYNLGNGSLSRIGLVSGKTYIISYWSTNGAKTISGGSGSARTGRTVNGWTYYEHTTTASSSTITLSGSGSIDEVRLYPQGAQMTSYTYIPLVGLSSTADANGEITYYEYDDFNRLKNVKDYQGNIIKNYRYNYTNSCGDNCSVLPMQTFLGSNTLSYPVGVFNINGKLLGNASNQSGYVTLWMSDTANSHTGTLSAGADSMHFQLAVNTGRYPPYAVTGCRYYQYDLPWNMVIAKNANGAYVDFGDGTGMKLGTLPLDTPSYIASNTTVGTPPGPPDSKYNYYTHTYTDNSTKTIRFYHNDGSENPILDDYNGFSVLDSVRNLKGCFPQNVQSLDFFSYGLSGAQSIDSIFNWPLIHTVTMFSIYASNLSYPQDFMRNNRNLESIDIFDTVKVSRLKSDWNTYFTNLQELLIDNVCWDHEDLSALVNLRSVYLDDELGSTPFTPSQIDAVINQVAAGAGQYV
ncbi:MAG TPA: hypothetical protein VLD19_13345, partial [Chitinophagaceae bacterium]|nr:hypothetical protein [Chitinophagaceae bacterium]